MNPLLVLLSACAAFVVLASPHNIARRHEIARAAVAIPDDTLPLQRRQSNNMRCQNRLSSSEDLLPTPAMNAGNRPSTQNRSQSPTPTRNNIPATTTPNPKPTTNSNPNNNKLPSSNNGKATFYDPGLGACGMTNGGNEFVVALSHAAFDPFTPNNNPNHNSLCNKMIQVKLHGKTVRVKVVDLCQGCDPDQLDLSRPAFLKLQNLGVGRIAKGVEWHFV